MDECPHCHEKAVPEPDLKFGGEVPEGAVSPTGGATFQYSQCQSCQTRLRRPVSDGQPGSWQVQKP